MKPFRCFFLTYKKYRIVLTCKLGISSLAWRMHWEKEYKIHKTGKISFFSHHQTNSIKFTHQIQFLSQLVLLRHNIVHRNFWRHQNYQTFTLNNGEIIKLLFETYQIHQSKKLFLIMGYWIRNGMGFNRNCTKYTIKSKKYQEIKHLIP